jgi:hypothetical protein
VATGRRRAGRVCAEREHALDDLDLVRRPPDDPGAQVAIGVALSPRQAPAQRAVGSDDLPGQAVSRVSMQPSALGGVAPLRVAHLGVKLA